MNRFIRKLYYRVFVRYERLELRYVNWDEGDKLIKQNQFGTEEEQWSIAKEEDKNRILFMVFLERKKRITE